MDGAHHNISSRVLQPGRRPRTSVANMFARMRRFVSPQKRSHRATFEAIYRSGEWTTGDTLSGPGSTRARTAALRVDLAEQLRVMRARVLVDVGCGDGAWIDEVAGAVDAYIGIDVVPAIVEHAARRLGGPGRSFLCLDATADPLPRGDVILCRDCLVHLPLDDVRRAIGHFVRSGSQHLIATTFIDHPANGDVKAGGWRMLNLQQPPFSFPPPLALIDERCTHSGGRFLGKRLGVWDLGAIAASGS